VALVITYKPFCVFRALFLVNMTFPIPIPFSQSFLALLLLHSYGSDKPHKSYCTHLLLVYRVMLTVVTTVIATNEFIKDCMYLKPSPKPCI
jgi:hypothetical protein